MPPIPTIAVVDDDQAIREAMDDLVRSCGYQCNTFASAEEFLASDMRSSFACLLLDVKMPGLSGLELQARLGEDPLRPPVIFITSYKDDMTRNTAMKGGAFAFLGKPVDTNALIERLEAAIAL